MRASGIPLAVTVVSVAFAGCSPSVDLTKALQVQVLASGWFDAGIVNGKNKLVPEISFTLTNASGQTLRTLQVNVLFRRMSEPNVEWGSGFVTAAASLTPGATTPPLIVRSQLGYTGADARVDMLRNSQFVDAHADLFAKYGAAQWTRLGDYPIKRELMVR
jgi:hypothetical protein